MKPTRSILLLASTLFVVFLLAGGIVLRVGAGESSYRQVVVFSEVLSLVLDNYVDPVDAEGLLDGAYEGMLAGLDANGAYLTPDEVREWKKRRAEGSNAGPGLTVLKAGRACQVVAVVPGSSADQAGITVGDQIRSVDDRPVGDLSLAQTMRLIDGPAGSTVKLEVMHPRDSFSREVLDVARQKRSGGAYDLQLVDGFAVLRILNMSRLPTTELDAELETIRARAHGTLVLDLRNLADMRPRDVEAAAALFADGQVALKLRDRKGELVESLESSNDDNAWPGPIAVLVNGATAGSAEALASLLHETRGAQVLGESTYGLGAEVTLYELENGSGLLVSTQQWETGGGQTWNGEGIDPDHAIRGRGMDYPSVAADQLRRAIEFLEQQRASAATEREAA